MGGAVTPIIIGQWIQQPQPINPYPSLLEKVNEILYGLENLPPSTIIVVPGEQPITTTTSISPYAAILIAINNLLNLLKLLPDSAPVNTGTYTHAIIPDNNLLQKLNRINELLYNLGNNSSESEISSGWTLQASSTNLPIITLETISNKLNYLNTITVSVPTQSGGTSIASKVSRNSAVGRLQRIQMRLEQLETV